eukprot:CAMPEP_0201500950 /NCGR_PEP_ID=MMETSP0151_2-20130828/83330_1 /ASSEMBLY_ACC=CAM_ASM_000257 /TAXON_ID=200890 /ORGANISM="Paramoeba atlantica, Strain 621/1 / CCAP 1560/9" /LENGTH=411 /DNA_ID=CAMNT_0047894425 /DNA_START=63 /DNA_END=1298 /DNA_ORIENTATION=+
MKSVLLLFCFLVLDVVYSHPTKYPDVTEDWVAPTLPPFRSYHVHVLFQPEHQSDACTGYDEAMTLRDMFISEFNLNPFDSNITCEGDFDQGRMCLFPVALVPFGPFPVSQWAAFFTLDDYAHVVPWMMQNRGPFSVFVHPNSGYERNDHHSWGVWMGQEWFLDLSAAEFQVSLPPSYPPNCRNVGNLYNIPNQTREPPARTDVLHVRGYNAQNRGEGVGPIFFIEENGNWSTPLLRALEQTYYIDGPPNQGLQKFSAYYQNTGALIGTVSVDTTVNTWHTLVVTDAPGGGSGGQLLLFDDDNTVKQTKGMIRFINLANQDVTVYRNGFLVASKIAQFTSSAYDEPTQGQYTYQFYNDAGDLIGDEPYFVNAENALTVYFRNLDPPSDKAIEVILVQDYPHDAPRQDNERAP